MSAHQTKDLLRLLRENDQGVRNELLTRTLGRLRSLAGRMFHVHPELFPYNDTDEVLQRSMIRLNRALQSVPPENTRAFFGLAGRQIRWVLKDMAQELARRFRHLEEGPDSFDEIPSPFEDQPQSILEWQEFHEAIDELAAPFQEIFDLIFYQGMNQEVAAEFLNISVRTVRRRWLQARLQLQAALSKEKNS